MYIKLFNPKEIMITLSRLRWLLSPYIGHKGAILFEIKKQIRDYKFLGDTLDVGCGQKPYKRCFVYSKKYLGIDFKSFSKQNNQYCEKPDYYFSDRYLSNNILPFKNKQFDNVVSFQVLEHCKYPEKIISEISRITKKGGLIFITAPFIWGIHEEPNDYYRFTKYGLTTLLESNGYKILTIKQHLGFFTTISTLINLKTFENKKRLIFVMTLFAYPFLYLLQIISIFLDIVLPDSRIFLNYSVVARKK